MPVSATQHSSSDVPAASDAGRRHRRKGLSHEGRDGRGLIQKEENMRVLTQSELMRATRTELIALLRRISSEMPNLADGSTELVYAHMNLRNIRAVLARPNPGPRP
jgi:hypothetical protein